MYCVYLIKDLNRNYEGRINYGRHTLIQINILVLRQKLDKDLYNRGEGVGRALYIEVHVS